MVDHVDNVSCRVRDIFDFSVHRGATVAMLVGEICSSCSLRDIVGPPSSLLDGGLENMLAGFDEVASRIMHSVGRQRHE